MINKKSFFILIFLVMLLNLAVICASNTEDTISKEKLDRSSQISQNTFENDHTKTNDNENTLFNKNKTYANAEISKSEQNSLKAGAGEENVNSYAGLVTAVNNAKTSTQENYTINLQSGNYDATEVIRWNSTGNCKTLIINGNNNILNGKGTIQFMQINSGTTVILNNIHLNNYYRNGNGGVIVNQGTLIIRNSSLTNSQAIMAGGAIYNSEANLIIENSTLTNNYATMGGGAIYNYKGNINIAGSKINGNYMNDPTYGGGAIYNRGTLTISNSSFTKNVIRYDANALGGAIYNYRNSILNITNTNFTSNEANEGGAIYNNNSDILNINNSTFKENKANKGGAIRNNAIITISQSTFTNNTASEQGGTIYTEIGSINISNSSLNNNNASINGGTIYSYLGNIGISNSSLSNNNAESSSGGSIYIVYSTVSITNSSLENNTSPEQGGAIYNSRGTLYLFNSSFNKNKAGGNGGAIYNSGEVNVTGSNFTENRAKSGAAIYSDEDTKNTITGNIFTRNTADNNETLVVNGNKTISNNIYDSTDINIKSLNLTLGDEKTTYSPDEDVMLNLTIELEHPEYYDQDIQEKINKTIYINNIENDTTTLNHYALSDLELGKYDVYFTFFNLKSNNVTFLVTTDFETNVSNYRQLVEAIKNATSKGYCTYKINLLPGDYNATENIKWENSATRKIIINGNGNTLNGQGTYQFIQIANEHNLTLENILITNYWAINGGAIYNYRGNLIIHNSSLNNNTATRGGAIYSANGGNINITQSNLTHNNATNNGGTIYSSNGNVNISNSSLSNNKAETSSGGSIYVSYSTVSITNSSLENNTSPAHGGAIYNNNGNLSIFNSKLNKNTAEWNGGAIFNYKTSTNIEFNVTGSNFTENRASSAAAICSDNDGITNTITENTFTRNTANNNETLVVNGNKTISNNIYDSTDISFKTLNLTLEDEKIIYSPGDDVMLNFMIELEHPEYYDSDILEKGDINKTLYINNIENDTTTLDHYTLSNLEKGTYDAYFTFSNQESNNVTFWVATDFETNVSNYKQLVESIKNATSNGYPTYKINLLPGDYNATENITWKNSATRKIIINGNGNTLNGQGTYQFIQIANGHDLTLENIILTNYTAQNGGVINNNGSLSIYNISLNNNSALWGGAIYNWYGNLNITLSNLTHNKATMGGGGAIYNGYGNLNITQSNLTHNNATNDGGAIYNSHGNLNIHNTSLNNNTVSTSGGAIYNSHGNLSIHDTLLNNNMASTSGGAIYNGHGNMQILNSSLNNNKAEQSDGGVIYIIGSTASITNSTLENNTSPTHGGAIYNYDGNLYISNSTLNKNNAEENGGAIYNSRRSNNIEFNVIGSNFTQNIAGSGAAIYSENEGITNTITGNIFTRNTANDNETLVVNGNKTINNNIYDSTDISFKTIKLTLEDEKTTFDPDEEVILNFTIELEHPEYYDSGILEKINKTIYINNIENDTTTLDHYTLSNLEKGTYDAYFISSNQKSNNVTFLVSIYEVNVSNYQQLVDAIKNATNTEYNSYKINLLAGDYNATENITWKNSVTRKIIINGNGNTLNGQGIYQFIRIAQGHNLTLENITLTNYVAENGGAIINRGNLIIRNTLLNNNNATKFGGAIYSSGGNINISNSSLNNNKVEQSAGGAIHIFDSTASITNSTLENNTSPTNGGAIYNNNGNLYIINSAFNKNKAEWNGGAICNYRRSDNIEINIIGSNFTENQASSGATIYSDNEGITNTITGNIFTRNTANNNETLVINGNKTISNNIYDSTDISFKTINLTLQDEKTTFDPDEDIILNFTIELEHPEYYDSDILEKINKTLYINNIENDTTTNNSYILSNLERGEYNVYFTSCNLQSNEITIKVVSDSTISSPEQSYEYYAGVNNKIPLSINDPSEEKGIITTIVKDENGFKILSSYYNIGNSYVLSVDALIDGLKNIYSTLNDSYSINVTYTSNNDYVNPSSTNFTLNIIKQRNTTIVYNILDNTEENVKINITVLDSIYNTPILDAPIQITGDITQNTTAGIIADNTLTPGEYTININYQGTDEYKESTATIDFTVEIDKDKKIAELQEQVENLTIKLEEAQKTIENLNNNITNLTQEIKQKDKQVEKLIEQINNLTTQLDEANDKINNLTTQ
ncbi:MAG: hypothetical protein E7Z84_07020, partial [Methanosphaera stadtmanae]|nr:hypothetical protein [Methanosphaera stadtmanae]